MYLIKINQLNCYSLKLENYYLMKMKEMLWYLLLHHRQKD